MAESALSDITVIDLGEGIAAPFTAKLFAAMGASVYKVEPPAGDSSRRSGPFPGDIPHPEKSGEFLYLNMGKKGLTLNVECESGKDLLLRLVQTADVLVENHAPSYLPSLGLGWETLHKVNPRLVMASITPFGQSGPYRDYLAEDIGVHAISGEMYLAGEPEREPLKKGGNMAMYHGGLNAYLGCMTALFAREWIGEGQRVDVSLSECATSNIGGFIKQSAYSGNDPVRQGNFGRPWPPGILPTKDGYIICITRSGTDWWPDFKKMMNVPELEDPRFATPQGRADNAEELDVYFVPWLMDNSKIDVFHAGQKNRLAFGYVATAPDLLSSPQLAHRKFWSEVDHPMVGPMKYPGGPFKATETPWKDSRAPLLGEHNEEVYCGKLGITKEQLVMLRQAGVI